MMTKIYRVMWVPSESCKLATPPSKNWRYVSGRIFVHFMGPNEHADHAGEKPMIFENPVTADRLARAMTDSPDVYKVSIREESTITMYDGIGTRKEGS